MRSAAFAAARDLDRLASVTQRLSFGTTPTNYAGMCSLQAHDARLQLAQSGPDIRHCRWLLMGAKRTCPRIPRTHRADPKLGIHNHSTAQKRLTTSLTSLASENRSFVKSHFRLQEQERFHSRTCPKDRPLVYCPCRLSESFQSGRPGDCVIYVCRR